LQCKTEQIAARTCNFSANKNAMKKRVRTIYDNHSPAIATATVGDYIAVIKK
jgi:hypothetical protein